MKVNRAQLFFIKYILLSIFLANSNGLKSQDIIIFNPIPSHFLIDPSINNSAVRNKIESSLLNISYNSGLGLLSELRNLYSAYSLRLNKKQFLSFKIYAEQETKFFNKMKFSGAYSSGVQITKKGILSFSSQFNASYIGFNSNFIKGNDWGLDFSASGSYETEKMIAGASFLQIPATSITPINVEIILERYIESFVKYDFKLSPKITWQTGVLSRIKNNFFTLESDNQLAFDDKYGMLGSLRLTNQNKLGFSVGGKLSLNSFIPFVDLFFSFSNITNQESINNNSYSISIIRKH